MNYFILALSLMFVSTFYSQEKRMKNKNVSQEIRNYISTNYPTIKKVKFYLEKQNDSIVIEAEFDYGKDEISLKFFNNELIEKETELELDEIPQQVGKNINNYLTTEYTKHKITECNLVEIPEKKNLYEIYIKGTKNNKSNYYEIYFDELGNRLKTVEVEVKPIQTLY